MMNPACFNRLGDIKAMVYDIQNDLHSGIDNCLATRATDSEYRLTVSRHDGRRHTGQWTLFWRHQIRRSPNLASLICDAWHCIKISQLVIQQVSTTINHNC